jgi:hypothetical protein
VFKSWFKRDSKRDAVLNKNFTRLDQLVEKVNNFESFTNEETKEYFDLRLAELPEWVVVKSVEVLRETLSEEMKLHVYNLWKLNPEYWVTENFMHHGWGTAIRNLLREKVCLDGELPSKFGYDDYYVVLVEIAVGARQYPNT